MAVYFPDILENNNPQYPLMDGKFLKGTAYPLNQLSETGSAAMLNRKQLGTVVFITSSQQYYGYYGKSTSSTDWDTPSNWRAFSTGSGGGGTGTSPIAATGSSTDESLYSTTPAAGIPSQYSARNSIFLGYQAGEDTTGARQSNFLGYQAGYQALNARYSNFLGQYAGIGAEDAQGSNFLGFGAGKDAVSAANSNFLGTEAGRETLADNSNFLGQYAGFKALNAANSTFIGAGAGNYAYNASHSVLIGYKVGDNGEGNTDGIGPNNIIIGTNITLADNRKDSINIGGIIFATGSYSNANPVSSPSIAAAGGKIGINVVYPTRNFEVSGTVAFPNLALQSQQNVVLIDTASGQLYYTASSAIGGGGTGTVGPGAQNYLAFFSGSTTTISSSIVYQSSSYIGVGTTTPLSLLHVNSLNREDLLRVSYDTSTILRITDSAIRFPSIGSSYTPSGTPSVLMIDPTNTGRVFYTASNAVGNTGTVAGSGTATYLPLWSGSGGASTTLIDSVIYQSASKVGIGGLVVPEYALDIVTSDTYTFRVGFKSGEDPYDVLRVLGGALAFPSLNTTTVDSVLTYNSSTKQVHYTASSAFGGGGGGTGAGFPFSGSAVITGSLLVSGSNGIRVTGSLSTNGTVNLTGLTSTNISETISYPVRTVNNTGLLVYENYGHYSILFSQSSTDDPTIRYTIVNNTTKAFSFKRVISTPGTYELTWGGTFTSNRTVVTLSPGLASAGTLRYTIDSTTKITIYSYDSSFTLADGIIDNAVLDIKIYS